MSASHTWDDAELWQELGAYEELCRRNSMRPKAVHSYWDYARRFLEWRRGTYTPRGVPLERRPTPLRRVGADLLRDEARAYARAIEAAGRNQATIDTYYRHAMFFVRWLAGEFVPGRRTRR
jgi:hypothetical protein